MVTSVGSTSRKSNCFFIKEARKKDGTTVGIKARKQAGMSAARRKRRIPKSIHEQTLVTRAIKDKKEEITAMKPRE